MNARDYAPLVLAEVKTGKGKWYKAKCFLDTGSNSSLVHMNFAKTHALHSSGACIIKFGIAGGEIHQEQAGWRVWNQNSPFRGRWDPLSILQYSTDFNEDVFKRYWHLQASEEKIYVEGGEVNLLIFYRDILGMKPTSLCVCSNNQILESAFIKHVQTMTLIDI